MASIRRVPLKFEASFAFRPSPDRKIEEVFIIQKIVYTKLTQTSRFLKNRLATADM